MELLEILQGFFLWPFWALDFDWEKDILFIQLFEKLGDLRKDRVVSQPEQAPGSIMEKSNHICRSLEGPYWAPLRLKKTATPYSQ